MSEIHAVDVFFTDPPVLAVDVVLAQGVKGNEGDEGPPGEGVATGGTTGQVLTKASATEFDTSWSTNISATAANVAAAIPASGGYLEPNAITFADPFTVDVDNGTVQTITLTASTTLTAITNAASGQSGRLEITQGGIGGFVVTLPPQVTESNVLSFNGTTQYGKLDTGGSGDFGAVTISAWIYSPASSVGSYQGIWAKGYTAYSLGVTNTHRLEVNVNGSTGYTLPTDQWVFLEVDYSATGEALELRVNNSTKWQGTRAAGATNSDYFVIAGRLLSPTTTNSLNECTLSNVQITGAANYRLPLAEGLGSTAYSTVGTTHCELVSTPTWITSEGAPKSNREDGFTEAAGVKIPAAEGSSTLDAIGGTLTNPSLSPANNGSETMDGYKQRSGDEATISDLATGETAIVAWSTIDGSTFNLWIS